MLSFLVRDRDFIAVFGVTQPYAVEFAAHHGDPVMDVGRCGTKVDRQQDVAVGQSVSLRATGRAIFELRHIGKIDAGPG